MKLNKERRDGIRSDLALPMAEWRITKPMRDLSEALDDIDELLEASKAVLKKIPCLDPDTHEDDMVMGDDCGECEVCRLRKIAE
jgi:hypothetical protein